MRFVLQEKFLPNTQLGMVRATQLCFLAWLAKAFSLVGRWVPPGKLLRDLRQIPLWHSVSLLFIIRLSLGRG